MLGSHQKRGGGGGCVIELTVYLLIFFGKSKIERALKCGSIFKKTDNLQLWRRRFSISLLEFEIFIIEVSCH